MPKIIFTRLSQHILYYPSPSNLNYIWSFGALIGLIFVLQLAIGIFLAMYCPAYLDLAFDRIARIINDVQQWWLLQYIYANGTLLMQSALTHYILPGVTLIILHVFFFLGMLICYGFLSKWQTSLGVRIAILFLLFCVFYFTIFYYVFYPNQLAIFCKSVFSFSSYKNILLEVASYYVYVPFVFYLVFYIFYIRYIYLKNKHLYEMLKLLYVEKYSDRPIIKAGLYWVICAFSMVFAIYDSIYNDDSPFQTFQHSCFIQSFEPMRVINETWLEVDNVQKELEHELQNVIEMKCRVEFELYSMRERTQLQLEGMEERIKRSLLDIQDLENLIEHSVMPTQMHNEYKLQIFELREQIEREIQIHSQFASEVQILERNKAELDRIYSIYSNEAQLFKQVQQNMSKQVRGISLRMNHEISIIHKQAKHAYDDVIKSGTSEFNEFHQQLKSVLIDKRSTFSSQQQKIQQIQKII